MSARDTMCAILTPMLDQRIILHVESDRSGNVRTLASHTRQPSRAANLVHTCRANCRNEKSHCLSEKRGVAELLGAACISFLQSFLRAQSGSRKSTFRGRTQIDPKGFRHRARRNDGLHRRPAVASKLSLTPDFLNARKIWKIFICRSAAAVGRYPTARAPPFDFHVAKWALMRSRGGGISTLNSLKRCYPSRGAHADRGGMPVPQCAAPCSHRKGRLAAYYFEPRVAGMIT